jgi:DNA-binding SARP family transcriptional activator/DNA-binding XRE family transcriptional regulator
MDDRMSMGLADVVQGFRRRAGLTQLEVAQRAGISAAALRDLEQGRVSRPRPVTLRRLATALALSESEAEQLMRATHTGVAGVRMQVLGPLAVVVAGRSVDPGSGVQRALLGLLALAANTPVSRDALIDVAWGAQPPPTVGSLLQTHISRLRRRLQPGGSADSAQVLVATAGGYQLCVEDGHLDVLAFRRWAGEAQQARQHGDLGTACELSNRALELWRGEPLEDVPALHGHPAVVALHREWQAAVVEYAAVATDLGRHEQVLPYLQQLTQGDPLHEAAHAQLMIALAGTGRQAGALDLFAQLRQRLAEELGADPGPELARAHERVLRQEITRPDTGVVSDATLGGARRHLPPDISDFTGRRTELAKLHDYVRHAGCSRTAVIAAIQGMAGVGKTRLAVRFAHQLVAANRYADVQLYVDLHGHAEQPPADPAAVLASFLRLLGVPAAQIPRRLDARAALYRDQLHGRDAIVVLDNAADEEQVQPLLPAAPTNLVVITSRRTLALDGAIALTLDVFSRSEAETLLACVAGTQRVAADPAATSQIIASCGRLPLAVSLAARRLQSRPQWRVADLAARLEVTGDRLGELTAGSRRLSTVFDRSYRALPSDLAAMFRLLRLHPGQDFTAESTAALAGDTPVIAQRRLDRLVDEHLVTMSGPDRFTMHELFRDYARQQAAGNDSEQQIRQARGRLLRWYLYAADRATRTLFPQSAGSALDLDRRPCHLPVFGDPNDAFGWLVNEHTNLIAAATDALDHGLYQIARQLPVVLKPYLQCPTLRKDWIGMRHVALTAARNDENGCSEATTRALLEPAPSP